jgi:hypothetical protein
MNAASDIPNDLDGCKAFIHAQASELAERDKKIKELSTEMDKLRRLFNQLVNGSRSQRRIHDDPKQAWLPFESEEELQAAQAEAQAEAEQTIEEYTVKRHKRNKKRRDESFPEHLPRVEKIVEAPDEMKNCPEHGERKIIGYDVTNTFPMPKCSFRPLHPVVMWKSFLSVDFTSTR